MRAEASMQHWSNTWWGIRPFHNVDGYDKQLRIQAKIIIKGSNLTVDYEGTSPQLDRGINCVMNYTYAYSAYPIKCALDPDTPRNEGSYKPIKVIAPEGSLVNPKFPAPVNGRQLTGHLSDVIYGCLKKVVPEKLLPNAEAPYVKGVCFRNRLKREKVFNCIIQQWRYGSKAVPTVSITPFPTNSIAGSMEL